MNSDPTIEHVDPQPRTLEQMKNYGTKWEILLKTPEKQFRLAFTAVKTKRALLVYANKFENLVLAMVDKYNCPDEYVELSSKRWDFGNGVVITFGRTEREVASEVARFRQSS